LTTDSQKSSTTLRLYVHPNSGRNEITGLKEGTLEIKVAAPPVKGKANKELIDFLSRKLGVSKSSLNIVKGHTSRNKVVTIEGPDREEILNRLYP